MARKYTQLAALFIGFISAFTSVTAYSKDGNSDARGRIDRVENGVFEITVRGETSEGPLWLGCTLFPGTDREQDLEAKRSNNRFLFWCSGEFEKTFEVPGFGSRLYEIATRGSEALDVPYVVALWRWKVERSECTDGRNGDPCDWCRKNGYHLEDRVDIGRGTWSFESEGTSGDQLEQGQREVEDREEAENAAERQAVLRQLPRWAQEVASNRIVPGRGLAGLQLGQSADDVISALGEPTGGTSAIRTTSGDIVHYAMTYKSDGLFLGVYLSPDSRRIKSFRLSDTDFNRSGILPTLSNGITIGCTKTEIVRAMGSPESTNSHNTGPESLGSRRATNLKYSGIEFCVSDANARVYWIDIP